MGYATDSVTVYNSGMPLDDVLRQLEAAFAEVPQPHSHAALAPPGIEARYVIEHFFGKTRAEVEASPFPSSLYMEDFTYMTEAGVRYYLPSVLRIMLARPRDDELWLFLHAYLQRIGTRPPDVTLIRLDPAQRLAIAAWARYLATHWGPDSDDGEDARRLANRYDRRGLLSDA